MININNYAFEKKKKKQRKLESKSLMNQTLTQVIINRKKIKTKIKPSTTVIEPRIPEEQEV